MSAEEQALIVFLKRPRPGEAKTRLIPALGAEGAAALYRILAEEVLRRTAPGRYRRLLFYAPEEARAEMEAWRPGERWLPQGGGSLGERMAAAFAEAFAGGASRAAIIGSDLPGLGRERVEQALAALDHSDLALGPARDGGYYLLALSTPRPEVFEKIAWSTPTVYAATRERAAALGLRTAELPAERDIDTLEDLAACWDALRDLVRRTDPALAAVIERTVRP